MSFYQLYRILSISYNLHGKHCTYYSPRIMKTQQFIFASNEWIPINGTTSTDVTNGELALVFGAKHLIADENMRHKIRQKYPDADIIYSSTAGEIMDNKVLDNTLCITAISFASTQIQSNLINIQQHNNSFEAGKHLFKSLVSQGLKSIFLVSDGTMVNGSDLIAGLNSENDIGVTISGGLAGDGSNFESTLTGLNETVGQGNIIAIGFYGDALEVYHSSLGGWDEFGRDRVITKSDKNVLYEIDGKNALDLYKEYLGAFSDELPGSALLFPISIKTTDSDQKLVRTILTIDEDQKSMTFAGNMPEGATVRLMKANFDKLTEASAESARQVMNKAAHDRIDLAILVSCVGRKLVLQTRTEEEVWAARSILGESTAITGFYSYGELSPYNPSGRCELHNQTMTITGFYENL